MSTRMFARCGPERQQEMRPWRWLLKSKKIKLVSGRSKRSNFFDDSADNVGNNDKSVLHEDYIQTTMSDNSSKRNLTKLSNLVSVCDRYCVSNYAGAAIASATLVDYGIIIKVNSSQIIGPQKLGDERSRCREEKREEELGNLKKLTFLYFDGKKSMTRVLVKKTIKQKGGVQERP